MFPSRQYKLTDGRFCFSGGVTSIELAAMGQEQIEAIPASAIPLIPANVLSVICSHGLLIMRLQYSGIVFE